MKVSLLFIQFSVFVLLSTQGFCDPPARILKKIDSEIKSVFQGKNIEKIPFSNTEKDSGSNNGYMFYAYKLNSENKNHGYLFVTQALGRHELFDFIIVFDETSVIKKVKIINYRSSHGYEIGSKGFLKQFLNKHDKDAFEYGSDINGISGATISGKAITKEINRLFKLVKNIK